ncbi:carboxypeptidase-like regulatory domain-containing protein [Polaribacter sp. Asnod1-A03]|uniref:carboxypeptidase-like regulatory domain-containing protein n=1 Tax=Polaribacter sp. Asnod1-A03 TaxID=3160581 RepID=UPI003870AC3B
MLKNILIILLLHITIITFSQERQTFLSGKVIDSLGAVKNVNIINLKTNQGTFSSDNGLFKIYASEGDSLQISSVQYITRKINVNKAIINNKFILINLKPNTYALDEFELKKYHLTGRLGIDLKQVPTNIRDSLLRKTMDFSKINMNLGMEDDHISRKVKPHKVETDPTLLISGISIGTKIPIPIKDHESILRKKLSQKKAVPNKILSELGESFFFEVLKIPKDNYYHFLEYCNHLGIEDLHKENKILELIKIFQKESVPYLKIIKKE